MVYVDALCDYGWKRGSFRMGRSCHLIADTLAELHAFAARLGMRRAWFQAPPKTICPHYDLTERRRLKAVELGAVELERAEFVAVMRRVRESAPAEARA